MVVLEYAILSIKSPHTSDTPSLKSGLQNALQVLNKASAPSGAQFSLFQQIENPQILHLLGSWTSVEAHHAFLPSTENLALLEEVKDLINVDLLFHAGMDKSTLPLDAPCVAFARHLVKAGHKEDFATIWGENSHHLKDFTEPYPLVGGWRIDGVEEGIGGEWVQFSGFKTVEHHHEFAKTEGFKEYAKMKEFLERFEVVHAKTLNW
ncbi:uncharacterized protein LAJ45_00836 [Morchella importuna]|uniref:ABM domain-containing protein n=1 Tax=Morchella conica CCBAS932 TaxID=1392247 RepID=A0A3N4KIC0_9PEZI|nr:uncharacterized protein LAJ45_00836 [Morchella importuna]KAH8155824.1 hypothetical protein LAJ45_00836 [Morchella importuna]RPB10304.1 hypothetical protein P167DRAFT_537749 [Morchella conica CCBAS932]